MENEGVIKNWKEREKNRMELVQERETAGAKEVVIDDDIVTWLR